MRLMRFVAMGLDGATFIVECDGEHFRLPVDERLRDALLGGGQLTMPLETTLSPREIQRRIRHGESAEEIAESAGMPIERVARYEGPVLAERAHNAQLARRARVDGRPLHELVDERLVDAEVDPATAVWDAWQRDDDTWQVVVRWQVNDAAASASWAWTPAVAKLRPLDESARAIQHAADRDDALTAVLRPVQDRRRPAAEPDAPPRRRPRIERIHPVGAVAPLEPAEPVEAVGVMRPAEPAERSAPVMADEPTLPQPAVDDEIEPADPAVLGVPAADEQRKPTTRKARRPSVPSWDDIVGGAVRQDRRP